MIVKREPRGDTKEAVKLSKFFSNRDNTVYPIQSDLQRRYCWPATHIEKFFKDYIIDLYEKNVEANLRGEDCFYAKIGDAILTRSEDDLFCDCRCKKQEVIDMSQRITTVMGIVVTMLYVHLRNIGMDDVDLRREIYNSYLRTKNGCSWKLVSTFKDNDFNEVIEDCINGSFKTDEESLRVMKRCFREGYKKKNSEGVYKPFRAICSYIYGIIDDTIGLDSDSIKDRLDMFLDQTYIQVEECEKEDRVAKFMEVNTFRVGIANKDIYKTLLCNKGESVDVKFQELEQHIRVISDTPKRINILKTPITITEYILRTGMMVMDKSGETCTATFSLDDGNDGLAWQLNYGFLTTEKDVLDYLDICIDICVFLENSMVYKQEGFDSDWYLLTEKPSKSCIWLYNILPAYTVYKLKDDKKRDYAFEMLLKTYTMYTIRYTKVKSASYIYDYMSKFAREVLVGNDKSCSLDEFKLRLDCLYHNTYSKFISEDLTKAVKRLDYGQREGKSAITSILSYMEYKAQRMCGVKRDNLYRLVKPGEIEIDHILPRDRHNDENELLIDSIGNLTLLEKSLNGSKNDNAESTAERYSDSSFITTKLMINGNRYEGLTNDMITKVRNSVIPYCVDKDVINNFEDQIEYRRDNITLKIKEFLS